MSFVLEIVLGSNERDEVESHERCRSTQKALEGAQNETRELLRATERNNNLSDEGSLIYPPPSKPMILGLNICLVVPSLSYM